MFKKFGIFISAALGLFAIALPGTASQSETANLKVQFESNRSIAPVVQPATTSETLDKIQPDQEARRRRRNRRGGSRPRTEMPAPCPACGMG